MLQHPNCFCVIKTGRYRAIYTSLVAGCNLLLKLRTEGSRAAEDWGIYTKTMFRFTYLFLSPFNRPSIRLLWLPY